MSDHRTELLARWAKLAPQECRVAGRQVWVNLGGVLRSQDDPRTELDKAIQLAGLIAGILARDWDYKLESDREAEPDKRHAAEVCVQGVSLPAQQAAVACDALLLAYLAALQTEIRSI